MKPFLLAASLTLIAAPCIAQQAPAGVLGIGVGGGGGLGSVPGLGGLLGGSDRAKESTLRAFYVMDKIESAARLAELVKSNENWFLQLLPMNGSIAEGFVRDFQSVLMGMRGTQREAEEIVLDPSGAGAYDHHVTFRKMQLDRDLAYLEAVSLRMETVSEDSARSSETVTGLVARNQTVEGGLQAAQVGNELSAVNARKQEEILATLQDILLSQNSDRALSAEEKLLAAERHCVMYPDECQ